MDKVIFEYRRK